MQSALVSVDTNSRALTKEQAAQATAYAMTMVLDRPILLKTIDSTLRGHIRQEVAAAFHASGRGRMVIAPAFPDAGRVTIAGIQHVHGTPVSDSDYGSDPVHPARTSRIEELIDRSLGPAVVVPVNASPAILRQAANARIVILDADSQERLNQQVARLPEPAAVLWVGSPGLAIALASLLPAIRCERSAIDKPNRRALIVAGSANTVTHAQCEALQTAQIPVVEDIASAPADAPIVCLRAPQQRQPNATSILSHIAGQAAAILALQSYDAVIATGGETMSAILERLGISSFLLTRELEPGFPLGLAQLPNGTPLAVAMKAGGFGSPTTLLHAAETLTSDMGHLR